MIEPRRGAEQSPRRARGQAEAAVERADESVVAAELERDSDVDHPRPAAGGRCEHREGLMQATLPDVARDAAIGCEQAVEAGAGEAETTAELRHGGGFGVEIGLDMALDRGARRDAAGAAEGGGAAPDGLLGRRGKGLLQEAFLRGGATMS